MTETLRDKIAAIIQDAPEAGVEPFVAEQAADRILALPGLAALKLTVVKPLNLGPSISTGTKKDD